MAFLVKGTNKIGGQVASKHNYSTTEQVVGTWIDGKPIYERTYIFNVPNRSGESTFSHNINDFQKCIDIKYHVGTLGPQGYYPTVPNATVLYYGMNSTIIAFYFDGTQFAGQELGITIQYTKTTD